MGVLNLNTTLDFFLGTKDGPFFDEIRGASTCDCFEPLQLFKCSKEWFLLKHVKHEYFFLVFSSTGNRTPDCLYGRQRCFSLYYRYYYVLYSSVKIYLNMTDSENFKNYGNIMKDMTDKYLKSHTWINSLF